MTKPTQAEILREYGWIFKIFPNGTTKLSHHLGSGKWMTIDQAVQLNDSLLETEHWKKLKGKYK